MWDSPGSKVLPLEDLIATAKSYRRGRFARAATKLTGYYLHIHFAECPQPLAPQIVRTACASPRANLPKR